MTSLFATTFIVLTTQVLLYVNVLTQSGQALSSFMKLALTLTPGMMLIVMPFALILGASNTLNRMNNDSELAVMEAAGAGRKFIIKPVLLLAVAMTLVSLFIAQIVEPWANRARRDLLVAASADLIQIAIQSGSFRELENNLVVQVADQYPGGELGGIFMVDRRDETTELIYYANRGTVVKEGGRNLILMHNGQIHRRNIKTGDVSVISFASYALDMSRYGPGNGPAVYQPKERDLADLLNPDPNDWFAKNQPQTIRAELHQRFSDWLYPMSFALIAIFFAGTARANRQERIWSMTTTFSVAFVLRGLGFVAADKAGESTLFAAACYALPLGSIAILSILLVSGSVIAVPQKLLDRVTAIAAALEAQHAKLMSRLSWRRKHSRGAI